MRMRAHWFRRLVVIGSRAEIELRRYRSRMPPKAVLHTLAAWEVRFDLAIYYFPTAEAAALQVESWTWCNPEARATAVLIAVRGQLVALDQIGSEEGFVER